MLSSEILKKIKKIHIKSGRAVNSMMAGQYKSVFRGAGIEFEEVREYTPGDDAKTIDWKVSARMGKPFVKLYREERELIIMLLLDVSASTRFGTRDESKMDLAAETASILAFNAIINNDKVGAILFSDQIEKYIPPKKGSSHVWRVIREFFSFEPKGKGTNISAAIKFLGQVCRRKVIAFLVSDFISSDFSTKGEGFRQMKSVSRKHELVGIKLTDQGDFQLPGAGIIHLNDLETGRDVFLDASDRKSRNRFQSIQGKSHQRILEMFKSLNIDCVKMDTKDAAADVLTQYFRHRDKRKQT